MELAELTVRGFTEEIASAAPAPGGGSAAALAGAVGAALTAMVSGLTLGRKKYEAVQELALRAQAQADALRKRLLAAMEQDTQAFLQVSAAYAMPKQTLEENYAGNEHVRIVTFTKKVNVYMNAADVMISKPGGLTSTEAAVAQVPLVQLLVYTACEAPNIAFFSSHGLSERAENAADAAEKAVALVRDKARAEAMREAQRNTIAPDAADKIAERIVLS